MRRRSLISGEVVNSKSIVKTFEYTGTVQQMDLEPGIYYIACAGGIGGEGLEYDRNPIHDESLSSWYYRSGGSYTTTYMNILKPTTVYVYVGGCGSCTGKGGWNGGGGGNGYSSYEDDEGLGETYYGGGGGASDIAFVYSPVTPNGYSDRRTTESYQSRIVVGSGGCGTVMQNKYNSDGDLEDYWASDCYAGSDAYYSKTAFGYGENQNATNYKYVSGAGGAGWYGGETNYSDTDFGENNTYNGQPYAQIPNGFSDRVSFNTFPDGTSNTWYSNSDTPGNRDVAHGEVIILKVESDKYPDLSKLIQWEYVSGSWNTSRDYQGGFPSSYNRVGLDSYQHTITGGDGIIRCKISNCGGRVIQARFSGSGGSGVRFGALDTPVSSATSLNNPSKWSIPDDGTHYFEIYVDNYTPTSYVTVYISKII